VEKRIKPVGKNSSPNERKQHKKVKVGGLNITPQRLLLSPQASIVVEESEVMPKV
jgi:hypothetical protein